MANIAKTLMPMVLTCMLAGIVLAILAPFGTHNFSVPYRFSYWVGLCLMGGIGAGATDVILHLFKKELSIWPCALLQSIFATLAVSGTILTITIFTYGMPGIKDILATTFYVWVISITIASIGALIASQGKSKADATNRPALYERLAPKLRRAQIYALAAEDHYVRVITSKGDELILIRLSDAIKETAPLKGLSPHRSWWVAEAGIDTVKKSEIILRTEQSAPISRSGMKLVREAGWV